MGAIGGGIWHGIKGARNSPRVSKPQAPSFPSELDAMRSWLTLTSSSCLLLRLRLSSISTIIGHWDSHRASASSVPSQRSKPEPQSSAGTSASGAVSFRRSIVR